MALKFLPEDDDDLRARLNDALEDVYCPNEIAMGKSPTPTSQRKHVFDFFNGMRLGVSVEKSGRGGPSRLVLHVSASPCAQDGTWEPADGDVTVEQAVQQAGGPREALDVVIEYALECWRKLGAADFYELKCLGVTSDVVHFLADIENKDEAKH